jgi:hypothetical protein
MTPEERESTERRLIEINRRLGFLSPHAISDEPPPELDAEEMDALYEEREMLMKELDEDVG